MLCRKFEQIPIKFDFLQIFKVAQKSTKLRCTCTVHRKALARFHQKCLVENSSVLLHVLT